MAVAVDDGLEQHNAAKYLRGEIRAVALGSSSDRQTRNQNYDLYRRTRRNALALWWGIINATAAETRGSVATDGVSITPESWPEGGDDEEGSPCLLWCAGSWHCATASWCVGPEKKNVKVYFVGYDKEDAVIVNCQDPRLRRAVLDPRRGRDQPNHQVLKGVFPKKDDHVRVHVVDAAEAPLFLQEGRYLAGVVVAPKGSHDSSLVEVVGLGGAELFLVPNTRIEIVTPEENARVVEIFEFERNQVLRQLDIATSQTIAIEVVSGTGKVVDDCTSVSLWALGDEMVIKVWQRKGDFMLETSVSAVEAFDAVGMKEKALTVLVQAERNLLLDRVRDRLRVSDGLLSMTMEISPDEISPDEISPHLRQKQLQGTCERAVGGQNTTPVGDALLHTDRRSLEGVSVEMKVMRGEKGRLLLRSRTLPPDPERIEEIVLRPENWAPLGFPSLRWLDARRKRDLAEKLSSSVCARHGSLAVRIDGRIQRYQGFIPINSAKGNRPASAQPRSCFHSSSGATEPRNPKSFHGDDGFLCPAGALSGLCSCGVLLRVGVSLPLITSANRNINDRIKKGTDHTGTDNTTTNTNTNHTANNDTTTTNITTNTTTTTTTNTNTTTTTNNNTNATTTTTNTNTNTNTSTNTNTNTNIASNRAASTSGRWLVVIKTIGSNLSLSLFRPSRKHQHKGHFGGSSDEKETGEVGAKISELARFQKTTPIRQSFSVLITWEDWEQLGYGPLQWMSHAQKMLLARLSLSWVSLKTATNSVGDNSPLLETVLQVRPTLVNVVRTVGKPGEVSPVGGGGSSIGKPGDTYSVCGSVSSMGKLGEVSSSCSGGDGVGVTAGNDNNRPTRYRVVVRDEGRVFRVELEPEELRGAKGVSQSGQFGKEAWRETGLGELLWMDCTWRQYLADRLSKQVAVAPTDAENDAKNDARKDAKNSRGEYLDHDVGSGQASRLVIVSDLPLLYWMGTVAIARLGSHSSGVFVTISDTGRRLLIEATDFEGGPLLASSTVSFEDWTAATGIHTLAPPRDEAFKKILEDQLAYFLGAGFRSRTSRLVAKRTSQKMLPSRRGRWRGTFLELSGMEMGADEDELEHEHDGDSGSEMGDAGTATRPRSSLPPVPPALLSKSSSSTPAQKRTLRLEMLMRMVDDYHAKHGRHGVNTGNATAPTEPGVSNDSNEGDWSSGPKETRPETRETGSTISGGGAAALPAITPSSPGSNNKYTNHLTSRSADENQLNTVVGPLKAQTSPAASERETQTKTGVAAKAVAHICLCCGAAGGKGHGRHCGHTFRRCGFCRAQEVSKVLFAAAGHGWGPAVLNAGRRLELPALSVDVGKESDDTEDEEYDWVTDTDTEEENPQFQCDTCGKAMEDTEDRYHCDTCSDYDLCQACFLSNRLAGGHESGEGTGTGGGHLASHQVTRVMGEAIAPFKNS